MYRTFTQRLKNSLKNEVGLVIKLYANIVLSCLKVCSSGNICACLLLLCGFSSIYKEEKEKSTYWATGFRIKKKDFFFILFVGYTHNTRTLTCSVQQGAGDCTRLLRPSDFIQILQTQVPQPVDNNNPCVIFERFRF